MTYERIMHPSDLTRTSQRAFAHALRLAVSAGTTLIVMHVDPEDEDLTRLQELPRVRETLHRWGLLDAPDGDVGSLGLLVKKILIRDETPLQAILQEDRVSKPDLLVLAAHKPSWFRRSQAGSMARLTGEPALIVPQDGRGFVGLEDGAVSLRRVLVPIAWKPDPQHALEAAAQMIRGLKLTEGTLRVVHVTEEHHDAPAFRAPQVQGWTVEEVRHDTGGVVERIVGEAVEWEADLVVMTTQGHDSLGDRLFGSTVEQVLSGSPCALLAVPAG